MAQKEQELPSWEQVSARKREALLASIPSEWRIPAPLLPPETKDNVLHWPETSGWFTADELAVTSLTASELVAELASGHLKSEAVTAAFCKRAAAAHQLVSLLTDSSKGNSCSPWMYTLGSGQLSFRDLLRPRGCHGPRLR